jgi:dephospho-CoA kinase
LFFSVCNGISSGGGIVTAQYFGAGDDLRVKRIMARDNISEEYAWMRVNAQHNSAWFQERCDYNLHNTEADTVETFAERARALFRTLLEE